MSNTKNDTTTAPETKTEKKMIGARVDSSTADTLEKMAKDEDRSLSYFVNEACKAYVANRQKS